MSPLSLGDVAVCVTHCTDSTPDEILLCLESQHPHAYNAEEIINNLIFMHFNVACNLSNVVKMSVSHE